MGDLLEKLILCQRSRKIEQDKGNQNNHWFFVFKRVTLEGKDQIHFYQLRIFCPLCLHLSVESTLEKGEHLTMKMLTWFSSLLSDVSGFHNAGILLHSAELIQFSEVEVSKYLLSVLHMCLGLWNKHTVDSKQRKLVCNLLLTKSEHKSDSRWRAIMHCVCTHLPLRALL